MENINIGVNPMDTFENTFIVPQLEFVFQIDVEMGNRRKFAKTGHGCERGYGPIIGGKIAGPMLNGVVVGGSGADYPYYRPDGVFEFDATYLLEADDGTPIILHNHGYRHGPPDIMKKLDSGEPVDPTLYYHRFRPYFEVPSGKHDWLSRTVFVGVGKRGNKVSKFRYYRVL